MNHFTRFTLRQLISSTAMWGLEIVFFIKNKVLGHYHRFLILTPPIFANQVVYDSENNKFIRIVVRDWIDFGTFNVIFRYTDYAMERFSRYSDVINLYNLQVSKNITPVIIDCGGNIGLASRYFSDSYPKSKVVCVEPDLNNLVQAKLNNNSKNVQFYQAAIGSKNCVGKISDPTASNNAFRIQEDNLGSLKILSINTLLAENIDINCAPFIIKIDIEGFENDLFSANTEWMDIFPVLIIEIHDWMLPKSANSRNFLTEVSKLNRDLIIKGSNLYSISNTII